MVTNSEMPFASHLRELRTRLVRSALAIVIGACLAYSWSSEIFSFLTGPLRFAFPQIEIIGTGPAEAFMTKLKVALFAGFVCSCPIWLYQCWAFIRPGLHEHEQRFAAPFVFFTSLFFLSGISFCFYEVLPFAFAFFIEEYLSIGATPNIRLNEYLEFVLKLVLVFGAIFEMPVFSYFLARFGLITHKFLLDKFRYAVVIIFIVAALLTPPDVVTQCLLAIPLMILYTLCIIIAYIFGKKTETKP